MNANTGTRTRTDISGIDRLRDVHIAAVNSGDADAWAACFTDDAVQMPPYFGANTWKAEIQGWSKGFLNLFACRFSLSVEEVQAAGEWAFERGATISP
jgi:ketosteroid isomerase-like protein